MKPKSEMKTLANSIRTAVRALLRKVRSKTAALRTTRPRPVGAPASGRFNASDRQPAVNVERVPVGYPEAGLRPVAVSRPEVGAPAQGGAPASGRLSAGDQRPAVSTDAASVGDPEVGLLSVGVSRPEAGAPAQGGAPASGRLSAGDEPPAAGVRSDGGLRSPRDRRHRAPLSPALSPSDGAREELAASSSVVYPTDLAVSRPEAGAPAQPPVPAELERLRAELQRLRDRLQSQLANSQNHD